MALESRVYSMRCRPGKPGKYDMVLKALGAPQGLFEGELVAVLVPPQPKDSQTREKRAPRRRKSR